MFSSELSVGFIGIYGIGCHASSLHIHEFLPHADLVLKPYPIIECLELDIFDERYAFYLYVVNLCTETDFVSFPLTIGRT